MDGRADAYGHDFQNIGRYEPRKTKPQAWLQMEYADVLVHRKGSFADRRILFFAGGQEMDAV